MNLKSLKLFAANDQVAWIGSGGKSSLIFSTARELFSTAIVTTTTHMSVKQSSLADYYRVLESAEHFDPENLSNVGITLLSKGIDALDPTKIKGFAPGELNVISDFAFQNSIPFFIEADGARLRPLKAVSAHEPQIPNFVTKVCVVAGLGALNKPLSKEWVHRPELFSKITGKADHSLIQAEDLLQYLAHAEGGLKDIPAAAQKILVLNQFDLVDDPQAVYAIALQCKRVYDHVLVTSVEPHSLTLTVHAHFGRVGCILLAAGEAKRFGSAKQLALLHGKTFIKTILDTVLNTSLWPVLVVTGAYHEEVEDELRGYDQIRCVHNTYYALGQGSSVQVGASALPAGLNGVIFLLVDQPQIDEDMIQRLLIEFAKTGAPIIAHHYRSAKRHPVLFSAETFPELQKLDGEAGGRQLFKRYPPALIEIDDPRMAVDFDTPEDLQNYLK